MNGDRLGLIGRHDLLIRIDSLITEHGSQRVICIEAEGGIGKTRLLQEIIKNYRISNRINVLDIFDFDEEDFLSPKYVGHVIAKGLGEENFHIYIAAQQLYHRMMNSGINLDELKQFRQEICRKFNLCFNNVSNNKRILLSFDTTDKLEEGKGMWLEFKNISQLQNVCVLLAGRNAHKVGNWLKQNGILAVENITLPPLNNEESRLYLTRKQESIYIARLEDELADKLARLSAGKPILLDLAVEWICQDISLEWIDSIPLEEIESVNCRKQFESELLQKIKKLRHPVDRLAQIMAYIYPLDKEMVEYFMGTDALFLMEEKYVFIKKLPGGCISLHDEVRRMVKEYVYPLHDESYLDEIKKYSKEAASYCKEKEELLKKKIKDVPDYYERVNIDRQREHFMERQVDYAFFFDTEEGVKNYMDVIWKLRHDSRTRTALRIQEKIQYYLVKFTKQQMRKYEIISARLFNDSGRPQEAERILEELLKEGSADGAEKADIHNALAPVKFRLGKLESALNNQLNSLKLLENIGKNYLPDIANYAGYLYERYGKSDKAVEYYQKALFYSIRNKKQIRALTAKILDNISHAYCQQGLHSEAQNYLDQAKKILYSLKNESLIARGEITQAVIYRDQRRYEESLNCLKEAIKRLREPDDHQKLIKAFFHRGWTCWFQAVEIDARSKEGKTAYKNKLKKSRQYFEHSLEMAGRYHLKIELPGILRQMSNVYHLLGEKDKAVEMNNRAYELSREVHDIRYAIDSLVGKAELDYDNKNFDKLAEYAETLKENYEDKGYDYPRFYGRMKRILADASFDRGDYDNALINYIAGLAQIRLHSGYGIYTIDNELEKLEKRMKNLPDEIFNEWCAKMVDIWSGCKPQEKYVLLLSWCSEQLASRQ